MFRLPVSGVSVDVGQITGAQDMLLLESPGSPVKVAIALAASVAWQPDGMRLDAAALPLTDLEALMLEQRRTYLGDEIRSRRKCPASGCGAETEISFRISEYVSRYRPRPARNAEQLEGERGWYKLQGSTVEFRLVTAGDVGEVEDLPHPELEMRRRTIRPTDASAKDVARAQAAMESLSPSLAQEIAGSCPVCGEVTEYLFDPLRYVQRELRYEAAFLYHDVHVLASRYHWPEEKILALPRMRRVQYAELALNTGATIAGGAL
jgi:hypothetical protein